MELGSIVIVIAILIFSVILHELAHGYAALWLGDPTAKLAGRLTLNPISHVDPLGSLIIPGILALTPGGLIFGWAKPVPYNPYNLSNQRWGEALVAAAGPATNIIIALVFGLTLRFAGALNIASPAFFELAGYTVLINILLALFNLIPFPPLDGSKVISAVLPYGLWMRYNAFRERVESFGLFAAIGFFLFFIYFLWAPFQALMEWLFRLITGLSL